MALQIRPLPQRGSDLPTDCDFVALIIRPAIPRQGFVIPYNGPQPSVFARRLSASETRRLATSCSRRPDAHDHFVSSITKEKFELYKKSGSPAFFVRICKG